MENSSDITVTERVPIRLIDLLWAMRKVFNFKSRAEVKNLIKQGAVTIWSAEDVKNIRNS